MTIWQTLAGMIFTLAACSSAWSQPVGRTEGSALLHTETSAVDVVAGGDLALPPTVTGSGPSFGQWRDRPSALVGRVPVVIFLHGSSGLNLKPIAAWQQWLSTLGIASLAPDSFALPARLTYSSPIDKPSYERIHALRASEIQYARDAVKGAKWADPARIVLAGTSEGAIAVARSGDSSLAARLIFSWSCEDNYFVERHATSVVLDQPILNVISSVDPFFSVANPWLGNGSARGHCAAAFSEARRAAIVLIPGAPHAAILLVAIDAFVVVEEVAAAMEYQATGMNLDRLGMMR
jgi:dienelactone hydrolase